MPGTVVSEAHFQRLPCLSQLRASLGASQISQISQGGLPTRMCTQGIDIALNSLLKESFSSWASVLSIFQLSTSMRLRSDPATHTIILRSCGRCRSSAWRHAQLLLSCAVREKVRSNVVCETANIGACGDWEVALALHARMAMTSIEADQINVNSVVASFASCSTASSAWQKAQNLVRALTPLIAGDRETYNALALTYSRAEAWERSLICFNDACSKSCGLDNYSVTALLTRSASGTHAVGWQAPLLIHTELARRRLESNLISWSAVISRVSSSYERASWSRCLDYVLKGCQVRLPLLRCKVAVVSLLSSMEACWHEAVHLCRKALPNVQAWTCLSRACSEHAWNVALLMHSTLQHSGCELDQVYCNSLIASVGPESWQLRLALLDLMPGTSQADHHTYGSLMAGTQGSQGWREAMTLLELAASRGVQQNEVMTSAIQEACLHGLQWKRPLEIMPAGAENPVVCALAIGACGKCGKWKQQLGMLSSWASARLQADESLYVDFGCLETRSWRTALATVQMWQSSFPQDHCMDTICAACAVSSKWQLMMFLSQSTLLSGCVRTDTALLRTSHTIQNGCVLVRLLEKACRDSVALLRTKVAQPWQVKSWQKW
ncbi:Hnrnpa0 [Symbiodinium natans]|uniref:Hnrnpa0 protein n=1 Tax=Symbiodinium natans TaxID=878477 RepID=A0A812KG67_9DINO|nr:Hnrnpa0 [Symbiodinium natans]